MAESQVRHFYSLTPEYMLGSVERALDSSRTGVRATGRWLALNSMENRVYDIELDDGTQVVAKFYRPGRWSRDAILDEHRFITELVESEVPAVRPMILACGATLDETEDGIFFAVFPKARGRIMQELDACQLAQIGRLLGRLHNVGKRGEAPHRLRLTLDSYGFKSLDALESSGLMDQSIKLRYRRLVEALMKESAPLFSGITMQRVHGDCHLGNVLWHLPQGRTEQAQAFFLDFDDMVVGPAIQDIWMVVRGRGEEAEQAREVLLGGYEQMRAFDRAELRLIEPLRALRIIHYAAWVAKRWDDPSFKNAFPGFGSQKYWFEELQALEEQLELIRQGGGWTIG